MIVALLLLFAVAVLFADAYTCAEDAYDLCKARTPCATGSSSMMCIGGECTCIKQGYSDTYCQCCDVTMTDVYLWTDASCGHTLPSTTGYASMEGTFTQGYTFQCGLFGQYCSDFDVYVAEEGGPFTFGPFSLDQPFSILNIPIQGSEFKPITKFNQPQGKGEVDGTLIWYTAPAPSPTRSPTKAPSSTKSPSSTMKPTRYPTRFPTPHPSAAAAKTHSDSSDTITASEALTYTILGVVFGLALLVACAWVTYRTFCRGDREYEEDDLKSQEIDLAGLHFNLPSPSA